jgi:hypothetical protein
MNIEIEKILTLKAFFLAHKISENSASKIVAMDMVDAAIKQLQIRQTTTDKLHLAFYHIVRSEVLREVDQNKSVADRKAAQEICRAIDSPFYEFFMKIENAVVKKKSLFGISKLTIVDEGELAHRDVAANALDIVWRRLSYDQIHFIDNATLVDLFEEHQITY